MVTDELRLRNEIATYKSIHFMFQHINWTYDIGDFIVTLKLNNKR